MNKKDVEAIRERISELTQRWESNQVKVVQLQQEVARLLEVDHSLRGGLSELGRILKGQAPEEYMEEAPEEKEAEKDGQD